MGGVQPDTLTSTRWFAQALTAPSALTLSCRWYVCFVRFVPLSTLPLCVRVSVCVHLRVYVCTCVYVCASVCLCVAHPPTSPPVCMQATILHMVGRWRDLRIRVFVIVDPNTDLAAEKERFGPPPSPPPLLLSFFFFFFSPKLTNQVSHVAVNVPLWWHLFPLTPPPPPLLIGDWFSLTAMLEDVRIIGADVQVRVLATYTLH